MSAKCIYAGSGAVGHPGHRWRLTVTMAFCWKLGDRRRACCSTLLWLQVAADGCDMGGEQGTRRTCSGAGCWANGARRRNCWTMGRGSSQRPVPCDACVMRSYVFLLQFWSPSRTHTCDSTRTEGWYCNNEVGKQASRRAPWQEA